MRIGTWAPFVFFRQLFDKSYMNYDVNQVMNLNEDAEGISTIRPLIPRQVVLRGMISYDCACKKR